MEVDRWMAVIVALSLSVVLVGKIVDCVRRRRVERAFRKRRAERERRES